MNKNLDSIQREIQIRAEQGMNLAKFLDSQVRILKRDKKIRKSINLPLNN